MVRSPLRFADNTWLTVTGPLQAASASGHTTAELMPTQIQPVAPPPDPYLVY
jgi:uncharacterized membrane protein YcgQ (UPF0703/DUF1980 family)